MRPYSAMMDQVILGWEGNLGREGEFTAELGECRDRDGRGWSCASRANVNVKWVAADKISRVVGRTDQKASPQLRRGRT